MYESIFKQTMKQHDLKESFNNQQQTKEKGK